MRNNGLEKFSPALAVLLITTTATLIMACSERSTRIGDGGLPDAGADGGIDVSKVIDSAGGTIEAPDGLKLTFPPGALNQATTIHIKSAEISVVGVSKASGSYLFEPTGLVFNVPITVSIPFNSAQTNNLFLYWSKLGEDKAFDQIAGSVSGSLYTASATHFSYGFIGVPVKVKSFTSVTSGGERIRTTNYRMDLFVAPAEPVGPATSPGHKMNFGPAAIKAAGR